MKKQSGKQYQGGRKAIKGPLQSEVLDSQDKNRAHKLKFKDGSQDARKTDGVVTVASPRGTMRSPAAMNESKRAAVTRSNARDKAVASE